MDAFNNLSASFSELRKPSSLRETFPYPITGITRVETQYGQRIRINLTDPTTRRQTQFHVLTGGRFLNLTESNLIHLNANAEDYVLLYTGTRGAANMLKINLKKKWASVLADARHAALGGAGGLNGRDSDDDDTLSDDTTIIPASSAGGSSTTTSALKKEVDSLQTDINDVK
jgi:hypothetical protein